MSPALFLGLFLLGQEAPPVPSAPPSGNPNWQRCLNPDVDVRINGCTAVILAAADKPRDLAEAYHNRANAFRGKRLFDLALRDYNDALALRPQFADAIGDRGVTLLLMGRYVDSIPDLTRMVAAGSESTYTYDRGLAYEQLGLTDLAIADFSAAIAQGPRDARRIERRGTVYFRKQDYDKALADYEQALLVNPQYSPALYGRGIVRQIKGDAPGGSADLARARRIQPDIDREMTGAGVKPLAEHPAEN